MQQTFMTSENIFSIKQVLDALEHIRVGFTAEEYQLHDAIVNVLNNNNIAFKKEYKLGPKNRIDFFIPGGIGIEVKKGKPNQSKVIAQLERYCSFKEITNLILVVERNLDIPAKINDKVCYSFGLNKLWGVAF